MHGMSTSTIPTKVHVMAHKKVFTTCFLDQHTRGIKIYITFITGSSWNFSSSLCVVHIEVYNFKGLSCTYYHQDMRKAIVSKFASALISPSINYQYPKLYRTRHIYYLFVLCRPKVLLYFLSHTAAFLSTLLYFSLFIVKHKLDKIREKCSCVERSCGQAKQHHMRARI